MNKIWSPTREIVNLSPTKLYLPIVMDKIDLDVTILKVTLICAYILVVDIGEWWVNSNSYCAYQITELAIIL